MSKSFSHPRHVWTGQPLTESPAVRIINLAYDEVDRIMLSFFIDLSSSRGALLEPSRPIKINGQTVQIADLPKGDPYALSYVERSDIDVTSLLKWSSNGENNRIEVYYMVPGRNLLRKQVGTLKLSLKIFLPAEEEKGTEVVAAPKNKFCMFCQKNIPDDSVCCCYCCERQIAGGANPKKCVNCSEMLPPRARFCKSCGRAQPDRQQ